MKALVAIDVQNDFCPGGALAVPDGDSVVPVINTLVQDYNFVVATRDWHPAGHTSFAASHGKNPGETVDLPTCKQILWPNHCLQGSIGADFHPLLDTRRFRAIFHKGFNPQLDSYSGFYENDGTTSTGLSFYLKGLGVHDVTLCGLATDYCVLFTALDAVREGFTTTVHLPACRSVGIPDGSENNAISQMLDAGVIVHGA